MLLIYSLSGEDVFFKLVNYIVIKNYMRKQSHRNIGYMYLKKTQLPIISLIAYLCMRM